MSCDAANTLVLICIQLGDTCKSVYINKIQPSFLDTLANTSQQQGIKETVSDLQTTVAILLNINFVTSAFILSEKHCKEILF